MKIYKYCPKCVNVTHYGQGVIECPKCGWWQFDPLDR